MILDFGENHIATSIISIPKRDRHIIEAVIFGHASYLQELMMILQLLLYYNYQRVQEQRVPIETAKAERLQEDSGQWHEMNDGGLSFY